MDCWLQTVWCHVLQRVAHSLIYLLCLAWVWLVSLTSMESYWNLVSLEKRFMWFSFVWSISCHVLCGLSDVVMMIQLDWADLRLGFMQTWAIFLFVDLVWSFWLRTCFAFGFVLACLSCFFVSWYEMFGLAPFSDFFVLVVLFFPSGFYPPWGLPLGF